MSDDATALPAEGTPTFAPALPADTGAITATDAAKFISEARAKAAEPARERAPDGKFAPKESPPEGADASPDEPVPGETVDDDPAELPPIEPPRSWSKEDKELFNSLPRETQERVSDRERSRESDFLRRQNEATEKTKALEAKEQAAEQARQQYEQAAQNALQVLQQQQASEFADIKTHNDVQKLATEDPFRFAQWQARQMQIVAQAQEVENLNRQRSEEKANTFKAWSKEQDDKFTKKFPEFADKEKAGKVREGIVSYLTQDIGVPEGQLSKLWETDLFRDAMFQEVVYDASRFRAAQAKAKAAVAVPKPQVQKPGAAAPRGSQHVEALAEAKTRLQNARGIDAVNAGAAAIRAQRLANARR
jgi:hypothetical protein